MMGVRLWLLALGFGLLLVAACAELEPALTATPAPLRTVTLLPTAVATQQFGPTPTATMPSPPTTQEKLLAGFSFSVNGIKRQGESVSVSVVFTRVAPPLASDEQDLPQITLSLYDDHDNKYTGAVPLNPEGTVKFLGLLPQGFQFVRTVTIGMPQAAPIVKLQVENGPQLDASKIFSKEFGFGKEFPEARLSLGESMAVGRFQKLSVGRITPDLYTWSIPVTVQNTDYNPGPTVAISLVAQQSDGTFVVSTRSVTTSQSVQVGGLSGKTVSLMIPRTLNAVDLSLLLMFGEADSTQRILRLWRVAKADFPPRVGQGFGDDESVFITAFQNSGGRQELGDPTGVPHWLAGGTSAFPRDEKDIVVQEFSSDFGKSAILWDAQNNARQAYVMTEPFWQKYVSIGGLYAKPPESKVVLGPPVASEKQSVFINGTSATTMEFAGGMLVYLVQGRAKGPVSVVTGSILEKWRRAGAQSQVGWPLSDSSQAGQSGVPGSPITGISQRFEKGVIFTHSTGALDGTSFVVFGPTGDAYLALGGSKSWLGYPLSDPYNPPSPGYQQLFEGGYIATDNGKTYQALRYESGLVAFVSDRDGNEEIYITATSGRSQVNLTRHPTNDRSPAFSPKGNKIAFVSDRNGGGPDIYVMNPDGNNLVHVITDGEDPAWFPDGSKIVFVRKVKGVYSLFKANADGSDVQQLPVKPTSSYGTPYDIRRPHVSPDGAKIAFATGSLSSKTDGFFAAFSVYVVNTDGAGLKQIFHSNLAWADGAYPDWSPKGDQIAFMVGGKYVYLTSAEGTQATPLLAIPTESAWASGPGKGLSWSPDGIAIAFARPVEIYVARWGIYIAPHAVVGSGLVRPIFGRGNNWAPAWGPSDKASAIMPSAMQVQIKVKRLPVGVECDATASGSVDVLDLESAYLPVVVASENAGAPPEALRAQAVASRTFALYKIQYEPRSPLFDVCDTEADQVYNPNVNVRPEHRLAVEQTRGIVAKWNGDIIAAFFVAGDDATNTKRFVTHNEGKSGNDIAQTSLGLVTSPPSKNPFNRGAMGQIEANELASRGWDYVRILRYFYGADLATEQLDPPWIGQTVEVAGTDGDNLNIRSSPQILPDNVVAKVLPGTRLQVLTGPQIADRYRWYRVSLPDGSDGWAASRFLRLVN